LAITSKTKIRGLRFRSKQIQYAVTYVITTCIALLLLNVYSSKTSQAMFYNSKETSMIEKCYLASTKISELEVLNSVTVSKAASEMSSLRATRFIVTDPNGMSIYDTKDSSTVGTYVLFPEIVEALNNNDVFSWNYKDGAMLSKAATPIRSYGALIGSVYMTEYDTQQGMLIHNLQYNTLTITVILEIVVILFSLITSTAFTRRLRKIMVSMRIIRDGDYSHRLKVRGHDELGVLAKEFNDLVVRLQTSEQKRNNFVSDASHELKTPLASIKLLTDSILQNDMDAEMIREFVSDIGNEADRLNRMSQKLLTLSRIESQSDSDCEIVYIAPTVERVTRMLSGTAEKNNVTIETDLSNDCPILILEDDLYQILFNLVENGIKYNTFGGTLSVILRRDQDNATVLIKDTGVGIPEEALEHVFERFYRVDKARSRKSGGIGLGLSIVRNMIERNRGTIQVESTVGKGTTFTVTFPAFDTEEDT